MSKEAEKKQSSTMRQEIIFYGAWIPITIILACLPLILPEVLSDTYSNIMCPLLLVLATIALGIGLIFTKTSVFKEFLFLLFGYFLFTCLGEAIYTVLCVIQNVNELSTPTIADVFWILAYLFLILGFLRVLDTYRGYRIGSKWVWYIIAWSVLSIIIVAFVTINIYEGLDEGVVSGAGAFVLLTYPLIDCICVLLLLPILSLYKRGKFHFYWLLILLSILVICIADILSSIGESGKLGFIILIADATYIAGYNIMLLSGIITYKFAKAPEEMPEKESEASPHYGKKLQRAVTDGAYFSFSILGFFSAYIIMDSTVRAFSGQPPYYIQFLIIFTSLVISFVINSFVSRYNKKMHAFKLYKGMVKKYYKEHGKKASFHLVSVASTGKSVTVVQIPPDYEIDPDERKRLTELAETLKMRHEDTLQLEEEVLRELEEELLDKEEELRMKEIELRKSGNIEDALGVLSKRLKEKEIEIGRIEKLLRKVEEGKKSR